MSIKKPDLKQWLEESKKIQEQPRFTPRGQTVILQMRDIRKETLKKNGRYGAYDQTVYVFPCKRLNGSEGFVYLNEQQFLTVMEQYERTNFPSEINFSPL